MATREASPKKLKDGDHDRDASCHNDERFFAEQVGLFRRGSQMRPEGGSASDGLRILDHCCFRAADESVAWIWAVGLGGTAAAAELRDAP
jgi:hypothetical protein